jgi:hypothetical protein
MNDISDEFIKGTLKNAKTIAIIGASNKPDRASNGIMKFLIKNGYNCIPINPNEENVLGQKSYKNILDVPIIPDIVDIFRKSEDVPLIIKDVIAKGTKLIWLQEGIYSDEARKLAIDANIPIVMDKCIFKEYLRLININ